MTRSEEINTALEIYFNDTKYDGCDFVGEVAKEQAFIAGAKWADEHPKRETDRELSVEELLQKLPSHIGRNRVFDESGKIIAYTSDNKEGGDMGWLYLHNDGRDWIASYGKEGDYVCLNPDAEVPPYNNAFAIGNTPREALQRLYDWCVNNNFIKS